MKYTLHGQPTAPSKQTRPATYAPDLVWQPLSARQRTGLALLAKRAWRTWGRGENEHAWRHAQTIKACGRRITEATQRDYLPIRAHFTDLLGQSDRALDDLLKHESEPHRIALHKLTQECSKRRLSLAYPAAICRRQYRCALDEASPQQLWRLLFTVKNRRKETPRPSTRP